MPFWVKILEFFCILVRYVKFSKPFVAVVNDENFKKCYLFIFSCNNCYVTVVIAENPDFHFF